MTNGVDLQVGAVFLWISRGRFSSYRTKKRGKPDIGTDFIGRAHLNPVILREVPPISG